MDESIAFPSPTRPLDDSEAVHALARELARADRIALDAEGDGFHRYRPRLCAMQLGIDDGAHARVAIVDTLAVEALAPLAPVLEAGGPVKVVHDASFDVRMLLRRGIALEPVFDTAIAARFLGETATGLASLLSRHFGVTLAKEQQQADWGARPLTEEQLTYLVADVDHLIPLARLLEARLAELDLLEEVAEESRYVLAMARQPEPARAPWTRIKGARELPPATLARLAALAEVREAEAERRDVPPFRVAPNAALLEAAQRGHDLRALLAVRGLRGLDRAALAEALRRAADGPPSDPEPPPPPAELRARRRSVEKALSAWRAAEAARRGVNEQAVLPGHCVRDLADVGAASELAKVPGLGEKRLRRYGAEFRRILESL